MGQCCGSRDPSAGKSNTPGGGSKTSTDGVNFKSMDPVRDTIIKLLKEGTVLFIQLTEP